MCLVPVYLSAFNCTIQELYLCESLAFTPLCPSLLPLLVFFGQSPTLPNRRAGRMVSTRSMSPIILNGTCSSQLTIERDEYSRAPTLWMALRYNRDGKPGLPASASLRDDAAAPAVA